MLTRRNVQRTVRAGEDVLVAFPSERAHLFADGKQAPLDGAGQTAEPLAPAPAGDVSK